MHYLPPRPVPLKVEPKPLLLLRPEIVPLAAVPVGRGGAGAVTALEVETLPVVVRG
ncbi:hypothetical protein IQ219_13150, partial [Synechocystis sp. LEGE 06083]|nr:hypothetical protein [Synechocystis sp. LEGE 06083]